MLKRVQHDGGWGCPKDRDLCQGAADELPKVSVSAPTASTRTLVVALAANLGIAASKFVAAAITGSSAMLTEGVHSVVDSTNQLLLMWGRRAAKRPPDKLHPFGYGRELYFWSFVVAVLVFSLGAGVSVYEGVLHIMHPEPAVSRPRLVLPASARPAEVSPRVARTLLTIGRHAERAESTARLLKVADDVTEDHSSRPGTPGAAAMTVLTDAVAQITRIERRDVMAASTACCCSLVINAVSFIS